jgi:hypothetical protein
MFDEPNEPPAENARDPAARAKEKVDECRTHAQLAAVFEGPRKFEARLLPLDGEVAREVQRGVGRLEKAKSPERPVLPEAAAGEAAELLKMPEARELSTSDYHVYRRPGEVMVVRWLAGEEVETFYERFQAHFDVALEQIREEERAALEWRRAPGTAQYLAALDKVELRMEDVYLRKYIREHNLFVLSTQTADEIDIQYLCEYVMGVPPAELVGPQSAPPEEGASERDRAWFFKQFALRGMAEETERMCFFTYLQKAEDTFDFE